MCFSVVHFCTTNKAIEDNSKMKTFFFFKNECFTSPQKIIYADAFYILHSGHDKFHSNEGQRLSLTLVSGENTAHSVFLFWLLLGNKWFRCCFFFLSNDIIHFPRNPRFVLSVLCQVTKQLVFPQVVWKLKFKICIIF